MNCPQISGLVAATYTPFDRQGEVSPEQIDVLTDHLLAAGIDGVYICGTTGEGMSLSCDERELVAERFVQRVAGRVPTIVQVGHNSLPDAQRLSRHAQQIGATGFSATCPSYFQITRSQELIEWLEALTQRAPDLPFYYYHIPAFTGSKIDIVESISIARERIPNLVGLKYTDTKLHEFQACLDTFGDDFDVLWGCDEMLLGAVCSGATAAIGSTYNIAISFYRQVLKSVSQGNFEEARRWQLKSIELIKCLGEFPFHSAMKHTLQLLGINCGTVRLPQRQLTDAEKQQLERDLSGIGFFEEIKKLNTEG